MDIETEELSHLEIVGTLARMHLKPLKSVREEAGADQLIAVAGGGTSSARRAERLHVDTRRDYSLAVF